MQIQPGTLHFYKTHIVDLRRSEWDKQKSDPSSGKFVFTGKKVYVRNEDYLKKGIRHKYRLEWVQYDPQGGLTMLKTYQYQLGADFVVAGKDPYWPEGLEPDAEGHYRFMDTVLMKIPLDRWTEKRKREIDRANREADNVRRAFKRRVSEADRRAVIDEEDLYKII